MSSTLQDSEISPETRQENPISGLDAATARQLLEALKLTSATISSRNHQAPTATMAQPQCTNCLSSSSNKRQSPSDWSPEQPSAKRAASVLQPSSSASSSGDQLLQNGFTKIPLPSTGLTRTLSAPVPTKNLYDQFSDGALPNSSINNPSAEENSGANPTQPSPKTQSPLYRTYSEPIPEAHAAVATSANPRTLAAGKVSIPGGLRKQESPDTKRFRRMKNRLREMSKWWNEVIKEEGGEEDEEEEEAGSQNNDNCPPKDDCELSQGTEASETEEAHHDQEAVWVERKGEVLILHFKCPCSKGYQILLSENNCYYKLSSF